MTSLSIAKHTAGPWSSYETPNDDDFSHEIIGVAGIYRGPECGANFQLLMAAPDLLDALKMLISNLPINRDWLNPDVERYARAAIAKAGV